MAKKFSVATDPLTAEETKAFIDAIEGTSWWHWLPNYWLIKDPNDKLDVSEITDILKGVNRYSRAFVMEINDSTWSALTKKDEKGRDMATWLKGSWSTD